jgi:hypothetical protein
VGAVTPPSDANGSGPTDRETALAAQIERLARQIADAARKADATARKVDDHDAIVANLAEAIAILTRPGTCGPQSWLWPVDPAAGPGLPRPARLGPDEATALMSDLCDWLARVYLRYADASLPTCWAWHPDVVEELLWLRGAHAEAYSGRAASWAQVGNWHDRLRPGVVKRIQRAAGTCELGQHRDGGRTPAVPLAEHASIVAAAWAHRTETPEPTASVVEAADRHERWVPS